MTSRVVRAFIVAGASACLLAAAASSAMAQGKGKRATSFRRVPAAEWQKMPTIAERVQWMTGVLNGDPKIMQGGQAATPGFFFLPTHISDSKGYATSAEYHGDRRAQIKFGGAKGAFEVTGIAILPTSHHAPAHLKLAQRPWLWAMLEGKRVDVAADAGEKGQPISVVEVKVPMKAGQTTQLTYDPYPRDKYGEGSYGPGGFDIGRVIEMIAE